MTSGYLVTMSPTENPANTNIRLEAVGEVGDVDHLTTWRIMVCHGTRGAARGPQAGVLPFPKVSTEPMPR